MGLLVLCGILLTLSFPSWLPRGLAWVVGMVALVPWGICLTRRPMNWKWVGIYYLFGLLWFVANLFWLMWLTAGGTIGLSFFCAVWIALAAWGTQRIMFHLRWPAMVAVPVVWVACEYLRGTVWSGFPWFLLGNSMTGNLVLLQMADLFGVWGVSFFCAMTSGWIVDMQRLPLWKWRKLNPVVMRHALRLTAVYGVILLGAVAYGFYRLHQDVMVDGPVVAVVQENIPQDADMHLDPDDVFAKYMALTKEAARGKPDLIVWPESMVLRPINEEWMSLRFPDPDLEKDVEDSRGMSEALAAMAKQAGSNLLVGSGGIYLEDPRPAKGPGYWVKNLSVLFSPQAGQTSPTYAKRHLVPFGEYIPFKSSWPWMNEMLFKLMPKGFLPNNEPGQEWTRLVMTDRDGKVYRFGTPICYEDVMPEPSQGFVDPDQYGKRIDFLINISNDGWYKSVFQLDQHLQMSQMRAVENRVPMVRSVNPGNSGFIDSCGRIVAMVEKDGERHFVAGTVQWKLRLDTRVSLFSRIGDLFGVLCGVAAGLAVAWTIVRPRRKTAEAVTVAG
jgi:apolipoprotein N-acyltransferase